MKLELTRIAYLQDVTLGRLRAGPLELVTLEEPWRPNPKGPGGQRRDPETRSGESCIPDGDYVVKPHSGARFQNVWRLSNPDLGVYDFPDELPSKDWGRAAILIHSGNTVDHILGCLLVGTHFFRLDNQPAVINSTRALNSLRELLGHTEIHSLSIRPTQGTSQ